VRREPALNLDVREVPLDGQHEGVQASTSATGV
jgi:hypothetical protein